jgi:poly(3-hydroxybutyrate) depolymerase
VLQAPPAVRRHSLELGGVRAHLVVPPIVGPRTRLVVVLHGVLRNGADYAERWAPIAAPGDHVVLAPEFDMARWPGARAYNLGNATGRGPSSFAALEVLCDAVRAQVGVADPRLILWGHSAGAQFVHRFMLFRPLAPVRLAIAASAGWYTAPDLGLSWPYGLAHRRLRFTEADVRRWASRPVVLMRGARDVFADGNLRTTPEAMRQGPHRHRRAGWMHEQVLRVDPASPWRLLDVPGVGHDDRLMARAAWPLIAAAG